MNTIVWLGIAAVLAAPAWGQSYPSRPIRLIVPQAPGSASDTVARIVASELGPQLQQQIVIDNRPGGAFVIGMELVARAQPDGYTLGYAPIGALAIGPNMVKQAPYDVLRDFQPLGLIATNQMLLAASVASPFRTLREAVDLARQNPGKFLHASSGTGSPGHVGMELFKLMSGTKITHVPYKGGAAALTDLIGGQVQFMMESLNSITPHAKAGRVRNLGVTGPARSPALPDVPTIAEAAVPGYEATTWNGIVGPARVPAALVARLNAEINRALASPALREKLAAIGAEPSPGTPQRFGELIRSENVKWGDVIRRSGAKID